MERALVVQKAANKLFATESSIDNAKATQSLAALAQARSAIVACHAEMSEAKLRLGVRTKLSGTGDKPPPGHQDIATNHLREVG